MQCQSIAALQTAFLDGGSCFEHKTGWVEQPSPPHAQSPLCAPAQLPNGLALLRINTDAPAADQADGEGDIAVGLARHRCVLRRHAEKLQIDIETLKP